MKNGRCRFHGGKSTGAKTPYRPIKHGFYTKEALEERRLLNLYLRDVVDTMDEIENK
jgi:hypothetical protein